MPRLRRYALLSAIVAALPAIANADDVYVRASAGLAGQVVIVTGNVGPGPNRSNFDVRLHVSSAGAAVCSARTNFVTPFEAAGAVPVFRVDFQPDGRGSRPVSITAVIEFWDGGDDGVENDRHEMTITAYGIPRCHTLKPRQ